MEKKLPFFLLVAVMLLSSLACRTFYKFAGGEFASDAEAVTFLPTLTPPTVPTSPPPVDLVSPPPSDPTLPTQQSTAEMLPTEAPPDPNLFFVDDFSDRNSGWGVEYAEDWLMDYFQDGYHILINKPEMVAGSTLGVDYADVRIMVDARLIGGEEDNYLGVLCRYQNADNYYAAVISSDGFYGILRRTQGDAPEVISGEYFVESIIINQHNNLNLLEVSCVGSQIKLVVNGQQLADVTDTTIPSGDVGLIVGTFSAASTDVLFDNFTFYLEE
jgi:hypothetical protein